MNIKNLLVAAVIFSATITSFNTHATNDWSKLIGDFGPTICFATCTFIVGAVMGKEITDNRNTFPKKEEILKLTNIIKENEATIKDLLNKNSEIEDFEIVGQDGIVQMRQSFGDTLDSLNKYSQENHIILTDKKGRNHLLCRGERSALFQNSRDFHKCADFMEAFELSKKSPITDNK